MTRWLNPQPVNADSLSSLNLHSLVAQTLIRRGITTPDAARAFLDPLHSPPAPASALPGMDLAVERISSAIRANEPICVWGDFDVDGQTSTTLLVQALRALGADVSYYIPIRGKESHGVHIESLTPIIDNGAKLIVTCDTGITANEAIDYANSRGVDVVVTDHHDLSATLPNAKAIVNPKQLPEDHPLANLAGVGVAYKLAEALLESQKSNDESHMITNTLLDLAALGLIADVALLKGETRSLAQKGIQALRRTNRLGLKVMAELSGTNLETLAEEQIGFIFAPRLNALGRLSDANPAVELLLTQDPARARVIAAQIEGLNSQRRLLTSQVHEAAEARLREKPELLTEPVIILSHPNWPGGVVGIVANRLVDRYHKPAILLTESEDGILRGSARSIEGLHITEAITTQKHILLGFGGHPMAAGLSIKAEDMGEFRRGLGRAVEKQLGETIREEATLQIDAWLELDEIDLKLASALESLAPFGAGNPPLVLATRSVKLSSTTEIGKSKEHLRLIVEDDRGYKQSIMWWGGAGEELPEGRFDIGYSIRSSTYHGHKQLTLQFEDFRIVEEKPAALRGPKVEVVDLRLPSSSLQARSDESFTLPRSALVWAEGVDKTKGKSRFDLYESDKFAIYTTPPSLADLRAVLEIVKPEKVFLYAQNPPEEKPEEFLSQLAGMAKFVIKQRRGKTSMGILAAAMAQRVSVIRLGLEWLVAGGHVSIQGEDDAVRLSAGNGEANQYLQRELYIAVKGLLDETAAYRAHFRRAPVEALMENWSSG